jgi:hypothetical protein
VHASSCFFGGPIRRLGDFCRLADVPTRLTLAFPAATTGVGFISSLLDFHSGFFTSLA